MDGVRPDPENFPSQVPQFTTKEKANVVEAETQSSAPSEGNEDEEVSAVDGDGDDISDIDADRIITETTLTDTADDVEQGTEFGGSPGA